MSDTTFSDNVTIVYSSWLNDINDMVYNTLGGATTAAQVRTNIGAMSRTGDTVTGSYNITGTVTATTLASSANTTVAGTLGVTGTATLGQANITTANISTDNVAQLNATNATFTNSPIVPTPSTADSTTKAASTAYVKANLATYATLASPALTGTPTAPTQSNVDSTTKLATTAFVQSVALGSGGLPLSQVSNVWLAQDTVFGLTTTNGNTYFDVTKKDTLGEITRPAGVPTFTATYAGTYLITLSFAATSALAADLSGLFSISTAGTVVQTQGFSGYNTNSGSVTAVRGSMTVVMTAGQTLTFNASLSSGTATLAHNATIGSTYTNNCNATIVRLN